ncbi:MAG: TolC family protein [Devosiaceae bacterium]|nr:TolC family protein [Devosiaceae bacterium MH13]
MMSVGGYNDDTIITGTLGPVSNSSAAAAQEGASGEVAQDGDPSEPLAEQPLPIRPGQPLADGEADAPAEADTLALSPALRLRSAPADEPTGPVGEPTDLTAEPAQPLTEPMANAEELGLRSLEEPLDLDPPVTEASVQAPAAASAEDAAEIAEGAVPDDAMDAGALDTPTELAGADADAPADGPMEAVVERTFSGEISVSADPGTGERMSLPEVVSRAATMHPEVTLALARVDEARATVERARSSLGPLVDVRLAAGQDVTGTLAPSWADIDARVGDAALRVDGTIRLRQLLYDFNATRDEIRSTLAASDAARLRTVDVTEDVALRTARAYLRIMRQRQLLALIDLNISEHLRMLEIVQLNEADGNSTMADVNRVEARLSEVRSARTDLAAELDAAEDEFQRLARREPGRLDPPDPVIQLLAPSADDAVELALNNNPQLMSLSYNMRSLQHELEVVNGDGRARVDLELEANSRNYFSDNSRSEQDVRGMVVFSYQLFDAGNNEGEQRQVEARIRQERARYTDRRDQVEADVRQAYRAIASSRRKLSDLREGLASSREVQALYTEQFQAGERTIFELLDAQNALYSAERELIVSQYSELEAAYAVLRATGRLTGTLLNAF